MAVTIDASVWVAARFDSEPDHTASAACIVDALAGRDPIVLPWLAWVECVAAVARKTDDEMLAQEAGRRLRALEMVRWVAVARRFGATLVTLDRELMLRCASHVKCVTPEAWLRR